MSLHAIAVALDLLASAFTGGAPWQTLSARFGECQGKPSGAHRACKVVCKILARVLGQDHCNRSVREYQRIKEAVDKF